MITLKPPTKEGVTALEPCASNNRTHLSNHIEQNKPVVAYWNPILQAFMSIYQLDNEGWVYYYVSCESMWEFDPSTYPVVTKAEAIKQILATAARWQRYGQQYSLVK